MEVRARVEYQDRLPREFGWELYGTFPVLEALYAARNLMSSGQFYKVRVTLIDTEKPSGNVTLWEETSEPDFMLKAHNELSEIPSPAEYSAQYQAYQEAWETGQDTARD